MTRLSSRRFFIVLCVFAALTASNGWAGQALSTTVNFTVSTIKADPARNLVYVVDNGDNRLLEFDMTTGLVVASAAIDDGDTQGEIAISQDGSTLYLAESGEDEIMVFSLPNLTPMTTLTLDFPPYSIACGVNGRLFASETSSTVSSEYVIAELNPSTGDEINTFGIFYDEPLLRMNATGTNLYVNDGEGAFEVYALSGAQTSTATSYGYYPDNLEDFEPDEAEGRIYGMNGGIYGVNVLILSNDNYSTVWPLTSAYGTAVGFSASQNVVYGGSGDPYSADIREYNRTNGAPITDYVVGSSEGGDSVQAKGIAVAPNGNVFYVLSDEGLDPTTCMLGIISSTGLTPTLEPTVDSVITFPMPVADQFGDYTLAATDNLGLPITYTLVSGPAEILYGDELYPQGNGTIVIQARTLGNAIDKAETKTITFNIGLNSQTIAAFAAIPDQTCGTSFIITTPTASSGLPVTLSVQSGSATIFGNRITPTAAGVLTLAADQGGNSQYSSAPEVTTSVVVNKGSQTILPFGTIPTQYYGEAPLTITLPASTSGLAVTISVQSGPATLAGNKLTLTGPGTVVLAADQAGNANYNSAAEVTTSFQVFGASQAIAPFSPIGTKTYTAVPFSITIPSASSGLAVTVSVLSGPATISGSTITLTGTGVVELEANQVGNSDFAPAPSVLTTFAVSKATQIISAFTPISGVSYGVPAFSVTSPVATSGCR
jgi:hypothetical protein